MYTEKFRETLRAAGVRSLKLPKRSPNLNALAEAFVASIRRECLNKMFLLSDKHVRYVISSFAEHYNKERPHKALNYCRPMEPDDPPTMAGVVKCHERLGGLLKSYYREAA